jgi:hypothetical protein
MLLSGKKQELVTFMTGQEQVDKTNKAMICDCDKYGHAHSAAGDIEPCRIRIELQCLNGLSADRFGHACFRKIVMAGNPDLHAFGVLPPVAKLSPSSGARDVVKGAGHRHEGGTDDAAPEKELEALNFAGYRTLRIGQQR